MNFPKVLKQVWMMDSADICVVGQHLGHDWNAVCDAIRDAQFYAQDGDGCFYHEKGEETASEMLDEIMNAIYKQYPTAKEITISN